MNSAMNFRKQLESGLTFLICTYNGADRIRKALDSIVAHSSENVQVKVIVVDNNSSDSTRTLVQDFSGSSDVPVLYLHEARQGKAFALRLGMSYVDTEITVILDDDNIISPSFPEKIISHFKNPEIGFVGGRSLPVLPLESPTWWNKYKSLYACGAQAATSGLLDGLGKSALWGAGLGFRTELWQSVYSIASSSLSGRNEGNLVAGEDSELCLWLQLLGYSGYYDDSLILEHEMEGRRLTEEYLLRLAWASGAGGIANKRITDELNFRRGRISSLVFLLARCKQLLVLYYFLRVGIESLKEVLVFANSDAQLSVRVKKSCYQGFLRGALELSSVGHISFPIRNLRVNED